MEYLEQWRTSTVWKDLRQAASAASEGDQRIGGLNGPISHTDILLSFE